MDYCFLGQLVDNNSVKLIQRVAHGGFAVVYHVVDAHGNSLAVRVPRADDLMVEQFRELARQECLLRESLLIVGVPKQHRWVAVLRNPISFGEFVDGSTLEKLCREGSADFKDYISIVSKLALTVDALHADGVVHGCDRLFG